MAIYKGYCHLQIVDDLGLGTSHRSYVLATENTFAGADKSFQVTPGGSLEFIFRNGTDGLASPGAANSSFQILLYKDSAPGTTTTLLRTIYSSTNPPADGTFYTIYGTANGASGGTPAAFTGRIRINAVRTGGAAGLGDYNRNSDSSSGSGNPTSLTDAGVFQSGLVVSAINASAYPAGATFAYGVAAPGEDVTLTATHTAPVSVQSHEQVRIDALEVLAVQASGTAQQIGAGSTAQAFTANNPTFDDASKSYGAKLVVVGNALLIPTSGAIPWTFLATPGSDQSTRESFYTVDPRITLPAPTLGQSLYNRGEATTIDATVKNARNESLTRSVPFQLKDSLGVVKASPTDTGSNYDIDYTLLSTDDAAADFVGSQWTLNTNIADVATQPSANVYKVSSKPKLGSVANSKSVGSNFELYNTGETVSWNTALFFARGDPYASKTSIRARVFAADGSTEDDVSNETTDANGLIAGTYVIASGDQATADAIGSPKRMRFDHAGNSTDDSVNEWTVSSKRLVDLHTQEASLLNPDDFPTENANEQYSFVILGGFVNTWVHVENIRNDGTEVNGTNIVTLTVRDPDGAISATYTISTGPDPTNGNRNGWSARLAISPQQPPGSWTYTVEEADNGNTGSAAHTIVYITPLTSNLVSKTGVTTLAGPGQTKTFYTQAEIDDIPTPPETLPTWELEDPTTSPWTVVSSGNQKTTVDDTETINGPNYKFDVTFPTTPGIYVISTLMQQNGNGIRKQYPVLVTGGEADEVSMLDSGRPGLK